MRTGISLHVGDGMTDEEFNPLHGEWIRECGPEYEDWKDVHTY